jgi:hypothetical protein
MIDESLVELIQRDIDGVCTPEESSRLQEILRTNLEARRTHEDLRLVATRLNSITPAEPPRTLKPSVLRAIDARRRPAARKSVLSAWIGGWSLRPVLTAAAGAVGGIALYVAINSALSPSTVNDADLAGTLILHGSSANFTPGFVTKVKDGETSATIETNYSDGLCFLKLNVASPSGVSAILRVDPGVVRFEGIRPLGTPSAGISVSGSEVRMENTSAGGLAVLVAGEKTALPPARLTLSVGGNVVFDEEIPLVRK